MLNYDTGALVSPKVGNKIFKFSLINHIISCTPFRMNNTRKYVKVLVIYHILAVIRAALILDARKMGVHYKLDVISHCVTLDRKMRDGLKKGVRYKLKVCISLQEFGIVGGRQDIILGKGFVLCKGGEARLMVL